MTNSKETSFFKRYFPHNTAVVFPLLLVCTLIMAAYMFLGYLMPPGTLQQQQLVNNEQNNESNEQNNSSETNDRTGFENAVVIGQNTAISSSADTGRVENLRLAADALDGTIIEPGATFSFNSVVGDVANDERYRYAPMVLDDEVSFNRGGGVSQVSSALYIAALYTNLVIEERHPHTTTVDYAPLGLDAIVVYSEMDLKLFNQSEFPIKINAVSEGQTVTVSLLGQPLSEGMRIEPLAVLIEYHMAGAPLPEGMDLDPSLADSSFYVIESFREFYYHGNKTESVFLSRDTYVVLSGSAVVMPDGNRDASK